MSMKLIMESWREHLHEAAIPPLTPTEDEILDLLDKYGSETNEGRLKNWLAAAGLAAAGAGGGVGIGSMIDDAPKGEKTVQVDKDDLTKKSSFGGYKGDPQNLMKYHIDSKGVGKAPTGGTYQWIAPEKLKGTDILPYVNMSVNDYKEALEDRSIKALHKHLFGTSGMWGGHDMQSIGGAQVLPPSWSVTFDVYRSKVQYQIDAVLSDVNELGEEGVSKKFGVPYEKIEKKLIRLKRSIETK
jgi:hypothetical protein